MFKKRIKFQSGVKEQPGYRPDPRNLKVEEIMPIPKAPVWTEKRPEDFKHYWNGQYTQDGSGSCVAWQISLLFEASLLQQFQIHRKLSARSLYGLGYEPDGGMWVEKALKLAKDNGLTLEVLLPSNGLNETQMRSLADYAPDAKDIAHDTYRLSNYIYIPKTFDDIYSIIQNTGKPLGTCIVMDDNTIQSWYRGGFLVPPTKNQYYHAITLTDGGLINGKKYISFEHAWGQGGFKNLGYGFIGEDYLPAMYVQPYYFDNLPSDFQFDNEKLPTFKYRFTQTMKLGDRNNDVSMLQDLLKILGYYAWGQPTTGYYGYLTYGAVKKFQQNANLPITGVVDVATLKALNTIVSP